VLLSVLFIDIVARLPSAISCNSKPFLTGKLAIICAALVDLSVILDSFEEDRLDILAIVGPGTIGYWVAQRSHAGT
jgi:hypothetical protein